MSTPTFYGPFQQFEAVLGSDPEFDINDQRGYVKLLLFPVISERNKETGRMERVRDHGIRFFARKFGPRSVLTNLHDSGFRKGQTVSVYGRMEVSCYNDQQRERFIVKHIWRPDFISPQMQDAPRQQGQFQQQAAPQQQFQNSQPQGQQFQGAPQQGQFQQQNAPGQQFQSGHYGEQQPAQQQFQNSQPQQFQQGHFGEPQGQEDPWGPPAEDNSNQGGVPVVNSVF